MWMRADVSCTMSEHMPMSDDVSMSDDMPDLPR
jgi:hypothetical protein